MTLKELARAAIFKSIPYFPARYTQLSLSTSLLDFISFNDFIDERMYHHYPLTEYCPIDCHFHHASSEVQCPDVEVSDMDGETDYSTDESQ